VVAVHHGFDADVFFADECPPSTQVAEKISGAQDCLKLLFVSHYNYYRNFETLFRAIALLRQQVPGQKIRLFLTCALRDDLTLGPYKTGAAARVIRDLGIAQEVVELGAIPYRQLHHVYRACHVYITPAYAETFAHPVVEAMACGLPVIASDIPAHREICSTALFFDRFSAEQLGARILEAAPTAGKQVALPERLGFSWSDHVAKLLAIASQLVGETKGRQLAAVARAETPLHRAS